VAVFAIFNTACAVSTDSYFCRSAESWPVEGTTYRNYYLDGRGRANSRYGDGQLSYSPPTESATDSFVYDPATPVPTRGGNNYDESAGILANNTVHHSPEYPSRVILPVVEQRHISSLTADE
jgi:predicted acyl esterase